MAYAKKETLLGLDLDIYEFKGEVNECKGEVNECKGEVNECKSEVNEVFKQYLYQRK